MNRALCLLSAVFIFANIPGYAEDAKPDEEAIAREGRRRAPLVLDIDTRVLENRKELWNETHRRVAIPGSPVGIKMAGSNVVLSLQFTPVIRRSGNVLVAQGQIWIDHPENGLSYFSSIQTIPMEIGEPIYFFPLGQSRRLDSYIEIMLTVNFYIEAAADAGNDR